ncbi:phosphotriesterase [Pseudomonas entomophila]|uniref:Imm26 family immunity protein n=1 Tax=Pseudomonas entomophila TaxID=312306 RepID=UPI0015E2A8D9|nr:Imm26 family immunity protein [Pseudomonas entomophila]MBA1192480.1 phosphotriesterase [Pseudomonas entomophila]
MNGIKHYEWDKRLKTKSSKVIPGDIFCFKLDRDGYGVGRIMTRNSLGHVAEIFEMTLSSPVLSTLPLKRLGDPIILDSYSLFDRKAEGDWRIIAHDDGYEAPLEEAVRFAYGVADNKRLVDIFDNEVFLAGREEDYPRYSPMGDEKIKKVFGL